MNYSPLVYAANLPKPTINKEIDKVLKAENDVLEESIKKAEANEAITNKNPCTPPKCDISWRSFFRKKNKTKVSTHIRNFILDTIEKQIINNL